MYVEIDLVLAEAAEEKEANVRKCNRILVGMELFPGISYLYSTIIYSAICDVLFVQRTCWYHNLVFLILCNLTNGA